MTSVVVRQLLGCLAYLGLWLAFLGLIASPNSHNRGYNQPLGAHPFPPPSYQLLTHATCDITVAVEKIVQNTEVLASRNSYKTLAKKLFA